MGLNGNFTLFSNDSGGQAGAIDYVKDAFEDISLTADNNTGLSSTISTNPLGDFFANDDSTKFGPKTLYIKDLVLIEDRSLWIQNKPTYRIIWNDPFPGINGHVFGSLNLNQIGGRKSVQFFQIGEGAGVTAVARKVIWLLEGDSSATATAQMKVDGVNTNTATFSNTAPDSISNGVYPSDAIYAEKYFGFDSAAGNQTYDLHDYSILSNQAGTLRVAGAIVYFENSGNNVDQFPGSTYVDKNKATSTIGATYSVPTVGSTLGARHTAYKTSSSLYGMTSTIVPMLTSIGAGVSGTNLLTVTTGQGASFPKGSGIVFPAGLTSYVGTVQSVSTDTLTMSPTLMFGIAGTIYKSWSSTASFPIGMTTHDLAYTFGKDQLAGFTNNFIEPFSRYCVWGKGITAINTDALDTVYPVILMGAGTQIQTDGYFSAAEVEFVGEGILNANINVNGAPAWSINQSQTGVVKWTMFSEAGPGWNSFSINAGSSMGAVGINKIDMYTVRRPFGLTLGVLSEMDTLQASASRPALNSTMMALGTHRRYFSDVLGLRGDWTRVTAPTYAGGVAYIGTSTTSSVTTEFFGNKYAMIGTPGTTISVSLDGGPVSTTFGILNTVGEGFHNLIINHISGTSIIEAIDVGRTYGEMKNLQNYYSSQELKKLQFKKVPIISDWTKFTMVITATTSNPAKGQTIVDNAKWRRVGGSMEILFTYYHNSAGSAGNGTYLFNLPPGYQIDESVIIADGGDFSSINYVVGSMTAFTTNDGAFNGAVQIGTKTAVKLFAFSFIDGGHFFIASNVGGLNLSSVRYSFSCMVPISGWGPS